MKYILILACILLVGCEVLRTDDPDLIRDYLNYKQQDKNIRDYLNYKQQDKNLQRENDSLRAAIDAFNDTSRHQVFEVSGGLDIVINERSIYDMNTTEQAYWCEKLAWCSGAYDCVEITIGETK